MLECSFGFRPRRSQRDALQVLVDEAWGGRRWVLESDVANCFEAIPHSELMSAIEERIVDRNVLKLLRAMLRAGVMEDRAVTRSDAGTPQGGVISPCLCNVYLHRLDRQWTERGAGVLVRYADDGVPRTLKEVRCRRRYRRMRCCMRDEGARPKAWWPFAVALQGEAANHREVRRSRAGVLSVAEKARCQRVRCGSRRRAEAISLLRRRKRRDGIETGVESLLRDEPGGSLLTGQVVPGVKVARAWSGLSCGTREPVAPMGRPASGAVLACGWSSGARTPSSRSARGRVVMRGTGADLTVVAMKVL